MLKMEYFKYVIEVSEAKSISKAAKRLFISQPYLSTELKKLEQELGTRLFIRNNQGIFLTPMGEEFLSYSKQICKLASQAENIKNYDPDMKKELTISSMYSFSIMDIYNTFSSNNQHAGSIFYEEIPNERIPDQIYHGISNIGIMYLYSSEVEHMRTVFASRGLVFIPLINEPLCAVLNSKHRLAHKNSINQTDLSILHFIIETPQGNIKDSSVLNIIYPLVQSFNQFNRVQFNNNRSLLYYITKTPNCYTVGQKSLNITNPFVISGELCYVPIEGLKDTLVTGYILNKNMPSSNLQKDFIAQLSKFFSSHN